MIKKVVIEYSQYCSVCRAVLSDIITILKKKGIVYVTRLIGDEYLSTFEFHLQQPSIRSMIQNFENIKNPELKKLLESQDVRKIAQLDVMLKTVYSTPRIYIFLQIGDKEKIIVINGAVPTKGWLNYFEKLIDLLDKFESLKIMV